MYEKLYLIHNPLTSVKDWVSERDFKIGSQKLRHVFGVLYLDDVRIMLQYNIPFKEAIIQEYNLNNNVKLTIGHVCRQIKKDELMELINKEINNDGQSISTSEQPYPYCIELKDGCYIWNEENCCYEEVTSPSK
ncbi:hypothetical protein [Calidifontibacillus oryziterrae]|uniref:hypothetical protein n=1 Tax=Calidifontibacillus oryziterrae TaxID=1191699 RepID=UPI000314BB76|nr:hypothetical protein [Calidifontibacillus oryziterrae]